MTLRRSACATTANDISAIGHRANLFLRMKLQLLLLLFATGIGQASDFFFIQMSDPQFGMYTADAEFSQANGLISNLRLRTQIVCGHGVRGSVRRSHKQGTCRPSANG